MIQNLASFIDHTILRANTTPNEIDTLCAEAIQYRFASVCISPIFVSRAAAFLAGSTVRTCTVVGFPLGATSTKSKATETQNAVEDGATEIDMVIPVGLLKARELTRVEDDICSIVDASGESIVKVIIEACLLNDDEKKIVCELSLKAGADFVKTSTGFSTGGATLADVQLMRAVVGPDMGVKAAGGIRDLKTALAMIDAGASRLGTSNGIAIIEEFSALK